MLLPSVWMLTDLCRVRAAGHETMHRFEYRQAGKIPAGNLQKRA
jgi:hypothetical protein